jgi:hypothetical protein
VNDDYLDHSELWIDEPVWLLSDEAALGWIDRENACHDPRRNLRC